MDDEIEQLDVVVGIREAGSESVVFETDVDPPVDGEVTGSIASRVETTLDVDHNNGYGSGFGQVHLENERAIHFDVGNVHCQRAPLIFTYISDDLVFNTAGPATKAKISMCENIEIAPGDLEYDVPVPMWNEICKQLPPAGPGNTFECPVCGHQTRVETPYSTVDQWCEGECDTMRTFEKL